MKRSLFILLMLCSTIRAVSQTNKIHYVMDKAVFLSKETLLNDLESYKTTIIKKHVNPFTQIKKKDFVRAVDGLRDSAYKYNVDQLLVELLKIDALIGDQHTGIVYSGRDGYPFWCYWFDDGIYITRTNEENKQLLYSKIVAVNNISIYTVTQNLSVLIAEKGDANIKKTIERYLFDPIVLHGLDISTDRDSTSYTLVSLRGDTSRITPVVSNRVEKSLLDYGKPVYMQPDKVHYNWFKYDDHNKLVYFNYTSCFENKDNNVAALVKELTECLENKHPEKLIIDLRQNRGGYPYLLEPFIYYLVTSPLNKKGHIYVLIGRSTFSAATINAAALRQSTYAKLIGEEAGGQVDFFAGVRYHKLPNTQLFLSYSTNYYSLGQRYDGSLRPDIPIKETLSDYLNGKDAALDYAITH